MSISNVLICDDKSDRAERWKGIVLTNLPVGATVDTLTGVELADLLSELSDAEDDARSGRPLQNANRRKIQRVEQADLLILDSDLSPAPDDLARLRDDLRVSVAQRLRNGYGDDVARQLRSYTMAPTIVVVNMFWGRHARPKVFDLTLNQNANSIADLNITAGELTDDALWGGAASDDYRPWQRCSIPEVVGTFQRSTEAGISLDLDSAVLSNLGIDPARLTPSQLDPFSKLPEELTFRDFAMSGLGFKYTGAEEGGALHEAPYVTAMALSTVRRWVERYIVVSQTVLLDAPHLAERYWRSFTDDGSNLSALDDFVNVQWEGPFSGFDDAVNASLRPFVSRPVFDDFAARKLAAEHTRVRAVASGSLDLAFAEDTSRFRPLHDLVQFPSDVPGDYKNRWLEEIDGIGYEPSNRLLL